MSSSSRRLFFETAHIFIIFVSKLVSLGWRISLSQPFLSFHRLDGRAPSPSSASPPTKRRRQPPSPVVSGEHQRRHLWALSLSSSSSSSTYPLHGMHTGRTKDGHPWSANRRCRNQRCQLRAWNRRRGAHRRPLCAWRRQRRLPNRREGQRNGISWPVAVVIIGLMDGGPGTELIIHQMGLNWEFYQGNMIPTKKTKCVKSAQINIQFCADFTLCAKPAQDY